MKTHAPDAELLKLMYGHVKDLKLGLLLSGLTILVKDTAIFLTTHGVDDEVAKVFRVAYLEMLNDNRDYWRKFGPELYRPLGDVGLPEGFASAASNRQGDLQPLIECDLETEWLRAPGWHFFQTYTGERKNDILRDITLEELKTAFCEGKNPYERESEDSSIWESKDFYKPMAAIVERLIGTDRSEGRTYWYPVMLYLVLLLHNRNFETLK